MTQDSKSLFSKLEPRNIPYRPTSFLLFLSLSLLWNLDLGWRWDIWMEQRLQSIMWQQLSIKAKEFVTWLSVPCRIWNYFQSLVRLDSIHQSIWGFLLLLLFWLCKWRPQIKWENSRKRNSNDPVQEESWREGQWSTFSWKLASE